MLDLNKPADIARETLKLLLARKMDPTPQNYKTVYAEMASAKGIKLEDFPEDTLKDLLNALPQNNGEQKKLARFLQFSIKERNWIAFRNYLTQFIKSETHEAQKGNDWRNLINTLSEQLTAQHKGFTTAKKRDMLKQVFAGTADETVFFERTQSLLRSWNSNYEASIHLGLTDTSPEDAHTPSIETLDQDSKMLILEVRQLLSMVLTEAVASQLTDSPELLARTKELAQLAHKAKTLAQFDALSSGIKGLAFRLQFLVEDRHELQSGLLSLLQLMLENVSELLIDDRWMSGQISTVREIMNEPINLRAVGEARKCLKNVVFKQSQLKQSLLEAKEMLRKMLAGFVGHLSSFVDSTSDYHDKIETCLVKVSSAENIAELENVLTEVIRETRDIQLNAGRVRDDLRDSQKRVADAEKRIDDLQQELDKASKMVSHDSLTGALNRQGLEESFAKEVARAHRRKSPLCVAMLDIDNFKRLNDSLGHDVGDAALIHLVSVIRQTIRPQDNVSRFGGEEFIILLPDTPIDHAETALVRLQRELTKNIFLHNAEKVLITFSAGISECKEEDTLATVTKRADEAMYVAKRTGKNRVVLG